MEKEGTQPEFMRRIAAFSPTALPAAPGQLVPAGPLVSVIIRTCNRPGSLRQTLESLRAQTARNFEVLVAEDGPAHSRAVCEAFSDLPLTYFATGEKVGRCEAGNRLLAAAKGELCNFLDDDDYFYPWHIAAVNGLVQAAPQAGLYCTGAQEARCVVEKRDGAGWTVKALRSVTNEQVLFYQMAQANRLPILTVAFRKALTDRLGGFDPALDAYEDWDLWMRLLTAADAVSLPAVTTLYKAQADLVEEAARILRMKSYRPVMLERFARYEKAGQNAGALAAAVAEPETEVHMDQLRRQAAQLVAQCNAIERSLHYRLGKTSRAARRARGEYLLPERADELENLVQCEAFVLQNEKNARW